MKKHAKRLIKSMKCWMRVNMHRYFKKMTGLIRSQIFAESLLKVQKKSWKPNLVHI